MDPYTKSRHREQFIESLISSNLLDLAVDWIAEYYAPNDVFSRKVLDQWAYDNGFKKFE